MKSRTPTRSERRPQRRRRTATRERIVVTTPERTPIDEPSGALVVPTVPAAPGVDVGQQATEGRRYVAVVSEVPGVEVFAEEQPAAARAARRETDRYATDIPILIVAALLAGVTFLEWYKGPPGFGISASGWQSGTWGPIIAFLAAGSVLLVALRRFGVRVSLPVDESLIHEGAGWISLVGAVVKSRLPPGPDRLLTASYGVYIAIGAAAVLIVLAGRMSPHAPFVVQPGWHRAKAGAIGIALILVVLGGSAVFGTINSASLETRATRGAFPGQVEGRLPECARDFPLIEGLQPVSGYGVPEACAAQLRSTKSTSDATASFRALLRSKKWVFTEIAPSQRAVVLQIVKPRCGTVVIADDADGGSIVAIGIAPCQPSTPSPRASPTPS